MRIDTTNGHRLLLPDEGKFLTDGETYSDSVFLGAHDTMERWSEVDEMPSSEVTNEPLLEEQIMELKSQLREAQTVNRILLGGDDDA